MAIGDLLEIICWCFPQWRYCIRLENLGNEVFQLRERHWRIFSLSGTLETVRGRGVVGKVINKQKHKPELKTMEIWFVC